MTAPGVLIIADASESARPFWTQIAKTVSDLIAALAQDTVIGVRLLSTSLYWEIEDWRPDMPYLHDASGSFLAPVMNALRVEQVRPQSIVIVGAGRVFDLADWIGCATRWALVHCNGESLQTEGEHLLEVTPTELDPLICYLHTSSGTIGRPSSFPSGFVRHQWELDKTGYPLVYVEPLNAYCHLFPVAKPQFERFVAEAHLPAYSDAWYEDILKLNPRLSPATASLADYEQLFISGLLPDEVQAYLQWHGGLQLPALDQWRAAFRWMETQDISILPASLEHGLAPTARLLWDGLLTRVHPRTLLDLSLMRNGLVEWVSGREGNWLGLGQPRERFYPSLRDPIRDTPFEPPRPVRRSRIYGFRLMRSA